MIVSLGPGDRVPCRLVKRRQDYVEVYHSLVLGKLPQHLNGSPGRLEGAWAVALGFHREQRQHRHLRGAKPLRKRIEGRDALGPNQQREDLPARLIVQEYFRILEDTRVAHTVTAWKKSTRRKPITTSKFYFFDTGVIRHLRNEGPIMARSPAFGPAFETSIGRNDRVYPFRS